MRKPTAHIAKANLLHGDRLYIQRARIALPILVRQAKAEQKIFYSSLAEEIKMPNARNLNYVLGAIGNAIQQLSKRTKTKIPPVQCLVINKNTGLPGEGVGWFISKTDFRKFTRKQKEQTVNNALSDVYSFTQWHWVLQQLQLEPVETEFTSEIEKAKQIRGAGGESPSHLSFKLFVSNHPEVLGLPLSVGIGQTEYCLPSADSIDVLFTDKKTKIGIEVKSIISNEADIFRGLFQCIKYKHLLDAEQIVKGKPPNSRVILASEGELPAKLISVRNMLGVEVISKIQKHV